MYRCLNCGHVFEAPTISRECTQESCGVVYGCPVCGVDDMAHVSQCPECGKYFEDSDLTGGLCAACLRESINFHDGLAYLIARKQLQEFIVYSCEAEAEQIGKQMQAFITRQVTDQERMLEELRDFILEDPEDFAKWSDGR